MAHQLVHQVLVGEGVIIHIMILVSQTLYRMWWRWSRKLGQEGMVHDRVILEVSYMKVLLRRTFLSMCLTICCFYLFRYRFLSLTGKVEFIGFHILHKYTNLLCQLCVCLLNYRPIWNKLIYHLIDF